MADRLHLTIGEVLSLLREEFPDVSISKIRFLESQGLVEPERTPSGYRKFYDHDVDRLRWILRQQREHFLPLKVIRGRLTGQEGDDPTGSSRLVAVESVVVVEEVTVVEAAAEESGPAGESGPAVAGTEINEASGMNGAETFGDAVAPEAPEPAGRPDQADRLFGPDDPPSTPTGTAGAGAAVVGDAVVGDAVTDAAVVEDVLPEDAAADDAAPGDADPDDIVPDDMVAEDAVPEDAVPEDAVPEDMVPGDGVPDDVVAEDEAVVAVAVVGDIGLGPTGTVDPASEDRGPESAGSELAGSELAGSEPASGSDGAEGEAAAAGPDSPAPAGAGAPDIYSVAEIAEAVGCTPQLIRELQQFGILVAASDVGGKMYFEPDAVGLARVGARFAELGVEPRHLRTWRNAADREASLFEQLVMPLLRQRNPQSRRQAAERLDELSTLGSQLRAGLLAEAVRGIK